MSARRRRWLLLGTIGATALGYAACTSSSSPPAAATSDAGLDAGSLTTFDSSLIPLPSDASGGGPCTTAADCPSGLLCLYPVAEGCSAHGVCEVIDGSCGGPYCTCRGDTTGACSDFGYLPMEFPLHGPPCTASDSGASDAGGQD